MCVTMVIRFGMERVGTGTIGICGTGQSPCLHLPDVRQIDYGTYIKFEKFCTLCGIILETWEQYRGDSYGQKSDVVKPNEKLLDSFWV